MQQPTTQQSPTDRNQEPKVVLTGGSTVPLDVSPRRRRFALPEWVAVLFTSRLAALGCFILLVMILAAIFAPLITPYGPNDMVGDPSTAPSLQHWFGTNHNGEDVFSQVVYGARISLFVGGAAGVLATALGVAVGIIAGYVGGWVDDLLTLLMNIFLVIPYLPLLIVISSYLTVRSTLSMILILAFIGWAGGARVMRSQTLSLRNRDFIQAALVTGESSWRIVFAEVMPNMISMIAHNVIYGFIGAVGAEAGLEFLGLGNSDATSWGMTLFWAQNNNTLMTGEWWHFAFPGLAVALAGTAGIFINYGIDVISNPRLRVIKMPKDVERKLTMDRSAKAGAIR